VRKSPNRSDIEYQKQNTDRGRYAGEVSMRFIFQENSGPWFTWLHVDPETLQAETSQTGWHCKIVSQENDGNYLASLSLRRDTG
jgi:hypothetical protein